MQFDAPLLYSARSEVRMLARYKDFVTSADILSDRKLNWDPRRIAGK
jgi:hypothetical protein